MTSQLIYLYEKNTKWEKKVRKITRIFGNSGFFCSILYNELYFDTFRHLEKVAFQWEKQQTEHRKKVRTIISLFQNYRYVANKLKSKYWNAQNSINIRYCSHTHTNLISTIQKLLVASTFLGIIVSIAFVQMLNSSKKTWESWIKWILSSLTDLFIYWYIPNSNISMMSTDCNLIATFIPRYWCHRISVRTQIT